MKLVGLTGGIGSGKSTVSRLLAERGAVVVDADQVARDLQQAGSPMIAAMAEVFGSEVIGADGSLDRPAVAALVFGDTDEARANLERLNEITHPAISEEINRQIAAYRGTDDIVILDHPLLVERIPPGLDGIIVVDLPVESQVERLVQFRGMDEPAARHRIANQISREERLAAANYVIDNAGDIDALIPQVDAAWHWCHQLSPSPHR